VAVLWRARWSEELASETAEFFDRWAREGLDYVWSSQDYDADAARWYRAPGIMAERLQPWLPAGARILDVGCGTGLSGEKLVEAGFRVSGIDLSAAMAEKARLRGYRDVRVGDATAIEWPDAFDCVLSVGLIGDWISAAILLPRLANALAPGGILAVTVARWSGQARRTRSWLDDNGFQVRVCHRALGLHKPYHHRQSYDFLIAQGYGVSQPQKVQRVAIA
jgi:SAM-dependent methyltransferase